MKLRNSTNLILLYYDTNQFHKSLSSEILSIVYYSFHWKIRILKPEVWALSAKFPSGFTDSSSTGPIELSEALLGLEPYYITPDKIQIEWKGLERSAQALQYQIDGITQIKSTEKFLLLEDSNFTEIFIPRGQNENRLTFSLQATFVNSSKLAIEGNLIQFSKFSDIAKIQILTAQRMRNVISIGQGAKVRYIMS